MLQYAKWMSVSFTISCGTKETKGPCSEAINELTVVIKQDNFVVEIGVKILRGFLEIETQFGENNMGRVRETGAAGSGRRRQKVEVWMR